MESESEGGQKFLPPDILPFCPSERLDFKIRNSDFPQKMFEYQSKNTANYIIKRLGHWERPSRGKKKSDSAAGSDQAAFEGRERAAGKAKAAIESGRFAPSGLVAESVQKSDPAAIK